MLYRSVPQMCLRGPARDAAFARCRLQSMQQRWASSSSPSSGGSSSGGGHGSRASNSFRAGVVDPTPFQVKPNFNIPLWQPPARFMKYRAVRWLSNNLLALATYQLALEAGFTIAFGSLLYADAITAAGVRDWLARVHYPFVSWIELEDCTYTEAVQIGPFALNPQKMTALHTGHNIANGLIPVQVVLMLSTFSPMQRVYRSLRHLPAPAAAAAAGASGGSHTAAAAAPAAGTRTATAPPRRASYARVSSRPSHPRQPF